MREDYKDVLGGDVEKVETNSPPLIYIFIFIFFYTFIKKKKRRRERELIGRDRNGPRVKCEQTS